MPVLTIHSHVVYGHVGNDAAAPGLNRLGVETWRMDTVGLSNHPGHGAFAGGPASAEALAALLDGIDARGALAACSGLLTGYLGTADQAPVAADAADRIRAAAPRALIAVDPIMGDAEPGLYVPEPVAAAVRDTLVPRADLATPNAFELGWLTGRPVANRADALTAARELLAAGPSRVLVTSLPAERGRVDMLAVTRESAWTLAAPRLTFPVAPNGAGDVLAGLVLGWLLRGLAFPDAARRAADAVHAVLLATHAAGRRELALTAAQDAIAEPPRTVKLSGPEPLA